MPHKQFSQLNGVLAIQRNGEKRAERRFEGKIQFFDFGRIVENPKIFDFFPFRETMSKRNAVIVNGECRGFGWTDNLDIVDHRRHDDDQSKEKIGCHDGIQKRQRENSDGGHIKIAVSCRYNRIKSGKHSANRE